MPPRSQRKSVTVQDVAKEANVSVATVSRAISNPEVVSVQTSQRVQAAIVRTGYRVNHTARNLRRKTSGAVLVQVPNLGNPFFSQILAALNAAFAKSGYAVLVSDTAVLDAPGRQAVDYLLDGRVDGVVCLDCSMAGEDLAPLNNTALEHNIVFACEWLEETSHTSVRSDNARGAWLAVDHLHALGHRQIAHITGPADNVLTLARREGFTDAINTLTLPRKDDWIIHGDFSVGSGWTAAEAILAMQDPPTAVFCASDMVALGLISGLRAAGIAVPDDISIVGFDDIELTSYSEPALTTIRQDRTALGERAAHHLLQALGHDGKQATAQVEIVDVSLVCRASCAPPRTQTNARSALAPPTANIPTASAQ